jgi:hypothetical protein
MNENELHSLVLASDYRVDDTERMWSLIEQHRSQLADLGAHHVVLYVSTREPDRVLVTIGLRHRQPVKELLRSPVMFKWFDMAGVNDIPAIFAGEVVEKIDLGASGAETGVIVGAVSPVDDVAELMVKVHGGLDRFTDAGVCKLWIYRALDDGREVLTLLQLDSLEAAQRWVDQPDTAAEWMPHSATMRAAGRTDEVGNKTRSGTGAYPSPFVGHLAHVMSTETVR